MKHRLHVDILPQPDQTTCGPTCLHAVYRYYGDEQPLADVIGRTQRLAGGGTLAVMLGCDALRRGYRARIYTYNLHVFDPTWFTGQIEGQGEGQGEAQDEAQRGDPAAPPARGGAPRVARHGAPAVDLSERLRRQREAKAHDPRLAVATDAYLEFLALGGRLEWRDLTGGLLRKYLRRGAPILTGLSSTYLYQEPREVPPHDRPDDLHGVPAGHFVVLSGYDKRSRTVQIADPLADNPVAEVPHYSVSTERVVCSILLGVLTYDANFLIVEPKEART